MKVVSSAAFDIERVRRDFPILSQQVYDKPLAYFDSAASAQKPRTVIDAIAQHYQTSYANIHRGVHHLLHGLQIAHIDNPGEHPVRAQSVGQFSQRRLVQVGEHQLRAACV